MIVKTKTSPYGHEVLMDGLLISSIEDSGTGTFTDILVLYQSSTVLFLQIAGLDAFTGTQFTKALANVTPTVPITFASGDYVEVDFDIPVSGW